MSAEYHQIKVKKKVTILASINPKNISMNKNKLILFSLLVALISCKKHDADNKQLGQLQSSDAYSLIMPDSADISGTAKIYKLTQSESLQEVKYIAKDGSDMGNHYRPEGIYDLGNDFFLLTLSINNQVPKVYETYIVRTLDGIANQVSPEFHPMVLTSGNWTDDYRVKSIKRGTEEVYFCLANNQMQRIRIFGSGRFEFINITLPNITSNSFDIDYQGHALIGSTFIVSPDTLLTVPNFDVANTLIVKSYENGFNLLKLKDQAITISHLYLQDNALKEDSLTTLAYDHTGWQYLNGLCFPDYKQSIAVFDKAIINITATSINVISLDLFKMNNISLVDQSLDHYFLVGTTLVSSVEKKVVLQIDPAQNPPTYSQLFVPDLLDVKKFHVTANNVFTVMAIRNSDQKILFRRVKSGTIMDVVNYQGIKTRQVFSIK